jgi:putative Mg2+ transporter-C (MgtC) family protein
VSVPATRDLPLIHHPLSIIHYPSFVGDQREPPTRLHTTPGSIACGGTPPQPPGGAAALPTGAAGPVVFLMDVCYTVRMDIERVNAVIHELNWISLILRTALAVLIGGILGVQRGKMNRPAGFRTHMLVCFGSALVMMTNQFVYQTFGVSDPVRLGAQVISGIGFLGAGSIIMNGRNQIKGITTAAGLWASACCGLAIGIGFYSGALAAGVIIYLILAVAHRFDNRIAERNALVSLYLEFDKSRPLSVFLAMLRENGVTVSDLQIHKAKFLKEKLFCVTLTLKSKADRAQLIRMVKTAEGLRFLEEM